MFRVTFLLRLGTVSVPEFMAVYVHAVPFKISSVPAETSKNVDNRGTRGPLLPREPLGMVDVKATLKMRGTNVQFAQLSERQFDLHAFLIEMASVW